MLQRAFFLSLAVFWLTKISGNVTFQILDIEVNPSLTDSLINSDHVQDKLYFKNLNITKPRSKEEMIILGMNFVRKAQKVVENQIAERFRLDSSFPRFVKSSLENTLKTIDIFYNSGVKSTRKILLASVETSLKPFVILLKRKKENINEILNSTFQTISKKKFENSKNYFLNNQDLVYKNLKKFEIDRFSNLNKTIDSLKFFDSNQFLNIINNINLELKDFYVLNETFKEKCNFAIFNFTKNILDTNKKLLNKILSGNFSEGISIIENKRIKFLDEFKNDLNRIKTSENLFRSRFLSAPTFPGDFDVVKFADFVRSLNVVNRSMFRRYLMNYDRSYSVAKNAFEFLNELKLGRFFSQFENVRKGLNNLIHVNIGLLAEELSKIFVSVYGGPY